MMEGRIRFGTGLGKGWCGYLFCYDETRACTVDRGQSMDRAWFADRTEVHTDG